MFLRFVGLVAPAFLLFCPIKAYALETGQCLPAATVRATLAEEGQSPIIVGNRGGYGYPTALIFTANADGSKGYLIRADKPLGEQAETVCIDSHYRDVRLNDITKAGVPAWATMKVDKKRAEAVCKRDHLGYQEICHPFDKTLSNLESNDTHLMFWAIGAAINPRDKSIRVNQRLVLTANPQNKEGGVIAVTSDGAGYILSAYTNASYTQHGIALLNGGAKSPSP